eukprot:8800827-Pyramimonas_sp.AAC.1
MSGIYVLRKSRRGEPALCAADRPPVRRAHCALGVRVFPLFRGGLLSWRGGRRSTVPGPGAVDVSGRLPWPRVCRWRWGAPDRRAPSGVFSDLVSFGYLFAGSKGSTLKGCAEVPGAPAINELLGACAW